MTKVGIFVHGRSITTDQWPVLLFGRPATGDLGDHATVARLALMLPAEFELVCVVLGRGVAERAGVNEGELSKAEFLRNLTRLDQFCLIRELMAAAPAPVVARVMWTLSRAVLTPPARNTRAELEAGAALLTAAGAQQVYQVTCASHAPRCVKEQSVLRASGVIPRSQVWAVVPTDVPYAATDAGDVVVFEPLHRKDQAMTHVHPGIAEVLAPYFGLEDEVKRQLIHLVQSFLAGCDEAQRGAGRTVHREADTVADRGVDVAADTRADPGGGGPPFPAV